MYVEPERAILADRDLLTRVERWAKEADHPLAKAAYEADVRYLRKLVDHYERVYFDIHGL